jgi:hypothetical protein
MAVGIYVGRPAYLEDQLRERSDGGDVTLTL